MTTAGFRVKDPRRLRASQRDVGLGGDRAPRAGNQELS